MAHKSFFKKYLDIVFAVISLVFLAILVGYYIWGLGSLIGNFGKALAVNPAASDQPGFSVDAAKKLDFRGLLPKN